MDGHAFASIEYDPETYGGALADLIVRYAVEQGGWTARTPKGKVSSEWRREFYFGACWRANPASRAGGHVVATRTPEPGSATAAR